jgi:hypothetical protein
MKIQGRPAWVLSPWMLKKISFSLSMGLSILQVGEILDEIG